MIGMPLGVKIKTCVGSLAFVLLHFRPPVTVFMSHLIASLSH